ncbi:MAG: quinolinate synthase NadA [Actinobacteria bacterium]|nr:quinolinate synthase NadA [Actinomycetota bacterium]
MSLLEFLSRGSAPDLASERGVSCTGELPEPSDPALVERALAAKTKLGTRLMILGHHYQRDEVIEFADITGDSFKLAQAAANNRDAELIVFCGVHFMAESADILTDESQKVILPDLAAGCSMADMATHSQVSAAGKIFTELGIDSSTIPVTYMNSSAAIKSFTGEHGGTICTSSNAERAMRWALDQGERIFFLPDQHLGRNTAVRKLGMDLDDCVIWNPWKDRGGLTDQEIRGAKVILWRGHCSVHGRFTSKNVADMRSQIPGIQILVHPECQYEDVSQADHVGSTEQIIKTIAEAPLGSSWAIGTELNLVRRLARENPGKNIHFLDKTICYCSTMNRIDLPHLVWALETLANGRIVNQIKVDPVTAKFSRVALERMLALP